MLALNRLSGLICTASLALVLFAAPANAASRGYIVNGEGWMNLSPPERVAYAQGMNDTVNFPYTNDDLDTAVVKYARTRCLLETRTAPNILADIITTGYTKNPQLMKQSPLYVYVVRLNEICRTIINEERAKMGLQSF